MKKHRYDERQLLARGKAYGIGCMTFFIELTVWEILFKGFLGISAKPLGEFTLLLSIPFMVIMIRFIRDDAYDPIDIKPGIALFTIMPLVAICMFIRILTSHTPLIAGNALTEDAGICAIYIAWVIVSISYWIKYAKDTKEEKKAAVPHD